MAEDEIIAITGHRDYPDRAALYRGINQLNAREYIFGGARGADSDALEYIAKTQPESVRTVVVPNRLIDQPASARETIDRYATRVIELKNTGPDRYQLRNQYMVDRADRVQAFYDFRGRGGTYNTIQYAESQGKEYNVWPMQKIDLNQFMRMNRTEFVTWFNGMRSHNVNLSAIKNVIIKYIYNILHKTVQEFINEIGYEGVMTLEHVWKL